MKRSRLLLCILITLTLCGIAALYGCNAEQIGQLKAQSEATDAKLAEAQTDLAKLKAQAATQPANEHLVKDIGKAEDVVNKIKPVAEKLKEELSKADPNDETAGFTAIVTAAGAFLGPYGVLAGWAATAGAGIYKTLKANKVAKAKEVEAQRITAAALNIPTAIEAAKGANGIVDFNDKETVGIINSVMTADAKAIVDKAQGADVKLAA